MLSPLDRRALKAVVQLAVTEAGGQENACNVSRITRHASFSEYGNRQLEDRHMPVDVAVDIDEFNGKPLIVRWMARRLGFVLVRAPATAPAPSEVDALLAVAKASADAVSKGWAARADGIWTGEERAELVEHVDRAAEALEALRLLLLTQEAAE